MAPTTPTQRICVWAFRMIVHSNKNTSPSESQSRWDAALLRRTTTRRTSRASNKTLNKELQPTKQDPRRYARVNVKEVLVAGHQIATLHCHLGTQFMQWITSGRKSIYVCFIGIIPLLKAMQP
eukprot:6464355-Amphidinium_carterae.1